MGGARDEPIPVDVAVKTYLYLRLSIVLSVALLAFSLAGEITRGVGWLGSISAYYYTPVRSVFVAVIVGTGFALVAIKGRPGAEDTLLNLAGMLAPLVAFVPTPIQGSTELPCPAGLKKCVPLEFVPGVENNVYAFLVVGAIALVIGYLTAARGGRPDTATQLGFIVSVLVWLTVLVWFGFGEDWALRGGFLRIGHYAAAIPMFLLIVAVVFINARRSDPEHTITVAGRTTDYRPIYRTIAWLMIGSSVVIGVAAFFTTRATYEVAWVFVIEAVLLALFAIFWVFQGWEYRDQGAPDEALPASSGSSTPSVA